MSTAVRSVTGDGDRKGEKPQIAPTAFRAPVDFARRIPQLDGFRGMAIAVALTFHYVRVAVQYNPNRFLQLFYRATPLLWAGMEMFFVLSGFLIGGILLDARESPNYFSTFYIRRFCRIMPVYFLFLSVSAVVSYFVSRPSAGALNLLFIGRMPWYAYFSFTQNFWMAKWNMLGPPVLVMTWSIAVEEQFYLALPLLVRFVRRTALPYVFLACIAIAPFIRLWIVYHYRNHLWATYVLLPCRMDCLCLGALCAYALRLPGAWQWVANHRTSVWGLFFVLLAGAPAFSNQGLPFTLLWMTVGILWMSVFFLTVLVLAMSEPKSFLGRAMCWKWCASLATIGYAVYLVHLLVYCSVMWWLAHHGWWMTTWKDLGYTLIALAITLGVSKLSWEFFEKPIVRWSHRWKYRPTTVEVPVAAGAASQAGSANVLICCKPCE